MTTTTPTDSTPITPGDDPVDAARRLRAGFRRLTAVEIDRSGPVTRCTVHGIGHRLPVEQPVSLRLAHGLVELGVPVLVRHGGR